MDTKTYSIDIGGKTLTAEFNDLVENADASVMMSYGDTRVLITAIMDTKAGDMPFFPLVVDYEEKFYAAGQILGSRFVRREGKPSDAAVLSARMVDRTIRPLFDQRIRQSTQVVVTVLSLGEDDPDVLAILGASLALGVSDIPWNGPIGVARIGKKTEHEEHTVNPTYEYRAGDDVEIDTLACGRDGLINMIEMSGNQASETTAHQTLEHAHTTINELVAWQETIITERGSAKRTVELPETSENIKHAFEDTFRSRLDEYVFSGPGKSKHEELLAEWIEYVKEHYPEENAELAEAYFEEHVDTRIHDAAIDEKQRADGRALNEVRDLYAQAGGISPVAHGSGVFYRGGTHILTVLTLGGPGDAQVIDEIETQQARRFMHHYNFPPFSVGETGRVGGFNRRQIGHGKLAEKALEPVLPSRETFPYTIRVVSEALSSNGSTSQGSICASTLALMDGGVPITAPVAGIAIGLAYRNESEYALLTDIQGPEDHHGDMDFKVAGTRKGITAVQMDVKVAGIPINILKEAFADAKKAREHILDVMEAEIATPRTELADNAPHIRTLIIKPEQIGLVIGGGGKTINDIKEKTGAHIDIEDDGTVFVTGSKQGVEQAISIIESITKEYAIGERIEGEVIKTVDFGAFVRLDPFNEGLLHISEIAPERVEKTEDYLSVGDRVPLTITNIDEKGRLKLSLKDADPKYFKKTP